MTMPKWVLFGRYRVKTPFIRRVLWTANSPFSVCSAANRGNLKKISHIPSFNDVIRIENVDPRKGVRLDRFK